MTEQEKEKQKEKEEFIENYYKYTYKELSKLYNVCEKLINERRIEYGLSKKKGRRPRVLVMQPNNLNK